MGEGGALKTCENAVQRFSVRHAVPLFLETRKGSLRKNVFA